MVNKYASASCLDTVFYTAALYITFYVCVCIHVLFIAHGLLEYSYDDMDDDAMSDESFTEDRTSAKEPTDAEYEKMLFENLTSEESDDELEEARPKKKKPR